MALSQLEKSRVRAHLGYPQTSVGAAIALGLPTTNQFGFMLEQAMNLILPASEQHVRRMIVELDCIEDQLSDARTKLAVAAVDGIRFRGPEQIASLEDQYSGWARKLADAFGVPINVFSKNHQRLDGRTIVIEPA